MASGQGSGGRPDAGRLIDGASDGLPGGFLATHADHWLLATATPGVPPVPADWLKRFARSGRTFDGIILDPLTSSREEHGRGFRAGRVDSAGGKE